MANTVLPQQANTKRALIDKSKTNMLIIISVASIVTIGGLVTAWGFIQKGNYINRVISEKEKAKTIFQSNVDAVESLKTAYGDFVNQDPNMLGGNPGGNNDRSGTNADLVLDALPNKNDFPALATSLENLLRPYGLQSLSGGGGMDGDVSVTVQTEMPFVAEMQTSFTDSKELYSVLLKSIRPIKVKTIEIAGNNSSMNVTVSASSYYEPEVGLQITEAEVQ